MSRAVRLSTLYAAGWIRAPDGTHHPWLLELDPDTFCGLPVGAAFDVPDQPPRRTDRDDAA